MDSATRTVNIAGVVCGCVVGFVAILLFGWWLWARFARPHGQHSNIDDHTAVDRLLRQDSMRRPGPPGDCRRPATRFQAQTHLPPVDGWTSTIPSRQNIARRAAHSTTPQIADKFVDRRAS